MLTQPLLRDDCTVNFQQQRSTSEVVALGLVVLSRRSEIALNVRHQINLCLSGDICTMKHRLFAMDYFVNYEEQRRLWHPSVGGQLSALQVLPATLPSLATHSCFLFVDAACECHGVEQSIGQTPSTEPRTRIGSLQSSTACAIA